MKAMMKTSSSMKRIAATLISISAIASTSIANSQQQVVPPRLEKITGEILQLSDAKMVGNAWFYGAEGCFVVTNYHAAFGKNKETKKHRVTGKNIERVVLIDSPGLGHNLRLNFDYNSKSRSFSRSAIVTVVALGGYDDETVRGIREDKALLRLDNCGNGVHGFGT